MKMGKIIVVGIIMAFAAFAFAQEGTAPKGGEKGAQAEVKKGETATKKKSECTMKMACCKSDSTMAGKENCDKK
jgi:hypothetical protein